MTNVTRNKKCSKNNNMINQQDKKIKIKAPIVDALKNAYENPTYQFHIPGHTKGNGSLPEFKKLIGAKALSIDTTDEFDGLGTLHPATGPIKEAQDLAAQAFGAKKTFFLLNGSTAGNLALAMDAGMVWITNPTYEGVVSDIKSIAEICKKHNVPLIVDEAHACLWNFNNHLPTTALKLGADAVVHSLHKTGGSMSQSSMLHIAENSKLDVDAVEKALKLLHTTSPSLMLLASLDAARANLDSPRGRKQLERAVQNAKYLRKEIDKLEHIHHLQPDFGYKTDITKVFIRDDRLSGKRLESILEIDFNVEVESASDAGLLILSNIGNTRSDMQYLVKCLQKIDNTNYTDICYLEKKKHMPMLTPIIKMTLREAYYSHKEVVEKSHAIGRISAEVIAECPPGIAVLLPGELITEEHMPYLVDYETIEVIK